MYGHALLCANVRYMASPVAYKSGTKKDKRHTTPTKIILYHLPLKHAELEIKVETEETAKGETIAYHCLLVMHFEGHLLEIL